VRFCPSCGGVVNDKVTSIRCASTNHDVRRRGGSIFCVDCGERLAKALSAR
jgi:transcriptional regulator NrdR family protein